MRVLIFEPHATGHHAYYLRWILRGLRQRQWQCVIATTPTALQHPILAEAISAGGDTQVHRIEDAYNLDRPNLGPLELVRREVHYWRMLNHAVRDVRAHTRIDSIILPYVDYCYHALALLGSRFQGLPWCGICMRLSLTRTAGPVPSSPPLKWRIAKRILNEGELRALFVINPSIQDVPSKWISTGQRAKLRYLPDPAELEPAPPSRVEARAMHGIDAASVAILVFGQIDERKGIDALVRAVSLHADLDRYVIILAGKQSQSMQQTMLTSLYRHLQAQKRLLVIDHYLSDAEQGALLSVADLAWVGYRKHFYMSGVLVLAGRSGLPVIGTSEGEIGRLIAQFKIGAVARISDPDDVARALRLMSDEKARSDCKERAESAFRGHTIENFASIILDALDPTGAR